MQALYFIGGYDHAVEKRTLAYATEHLLAIIVASGVSALLIYSAATFDQTMKPSRAVLLLSFMIFLPVSLFYRRWIQKYVAAGDINRAFLVIGSGPAAVRFYEAYQRSPNSQQLHFVDLGGQRAGQRIAGEASPVVEGDIASRLDDLGERALVVGREVHDDHVDHAAVGGHGTEETLQGRDAAGRPAEADHRQHLVRAARHRVVDDVGEIFLRVVGGGLQSRLGDGRRRVR